MTDGNSPIADMYPDKFLVDLELKPFTSRNKMFKTFMATAVLPPMYIERVINVTKTIKFGANFIRDVTPTGHQTYLRDQKINDILCEKRLQERQFKSLKKMHDNRITGKNLGKR